MRMLTMLRLERTRGSIAATASSIATMRSGSSMARIQPTRPRPFASCGWRTLSALLDTRGSPLRQLLERDGEDDDDAEEDGLDAWVDRQEVHGVGEDEEEDGSERHHLDPADAALEADPGDDGGGDA